MTEGNGGDLEQNGPRTGAGLVVPLLHLLNERQSAHKEQHQLEAKAVLVALTANDRRLQGMNKFREEIEKDRLQFLTAEKFEGYVKGEEARRRSTNITLATLGLTVAGLLIAVINLLAS